MNDIDYQAIYTDQNIVYFGQGAYLTPDMLKSTASEISKAFISTMLNDGVPTGGLAMTFDIGSPFDEIDIQYEYDTESGKWRTVCMLYDRFESPSLSDIRSISSIKDPYALEKTVSDMISSLNIPIHERAKIDKELDLQAAVSFYSNAIGVNIMNEHVKSYADELIFCHKNHKGIIDFDFWTHYDDILDEKLTFDEYTQLDNLFDGDPLELSSQDTKTIDSLQLALHSIRSGIPVEKQTEPDFEFHSSKEHASFTVKSKWLQGFFDVDNHAQLEALILDREAFGGLVPDEILKAASLDTKGSGLQIMPITAPSRQEVIAYFKDNGRPDAYSGWIDSFISPLDPNRKEQYWEAVKCRYDLADFDRWQHFQDIIGRECSWQCFSACNEAIWEEGLDVLDLGIESKQDIRTQTPFDQLLTSAEAQKGEQKTSPEVGNPNDKYIFSK